MKVVKLNWPGSTRFVDAQPGEGCCGCDCGPPKVFDGGTRKAPSIVSSPGWFPDKDLDDGFRHSSARLAANPSLCGYLLPVRRVPASRSQVAGCVTAPRDPGREITTVRMGVDRVA